MKLTARVSQGSGEYFVVPTSIVPHLITEVRVYSSTFEHVREEHGAEVGAILDMPVMSNAIVNAIRSPTRVESARPGSVKFIDATSVNFSGSPLIVLVKAVSGTSGRMQTLYFGETNSSSNVIWKKGNA